MKKVLFGIAMAVTALFGLAAPMAVAPVYASPADTALGNLGGDTGDKPLMDSVNKIIEVILGLVGVIAVIMIIIGGISFITSQGDPGKAAKARNTILYGVIGLVVALLAFAIVKFVLSEGLGAKTE